MSRHKRTIRRLALLAGTVLSAVAVAAFAASRSTAERFEDPAELADHAAAALRGARSEGAGRQAPLNLSRAEELYGEALLERRRQQLRFGWFRDFRPARAALESAVHRAEEATAVAHRSTKRDRFAANQSLAEADVTLAALAGTENRIWMPDDVRQRLQRARALASEARALLAHEAFADAALRAAESRAEAEEVARALHLTTSRFTEEDLIVQWRRWAAETVAWSRRTGKAAVIVDKDAHLVQVYQEGRMVREWSAELGWNNIGDKRHQGDGATPEGRYRVTDLKSRGRTRYHKALLLDYPNPDDLAALAALKASGAVPAGTHPGGLIEIHGHGGRGKDWTDGCVALTNAQMDWLFARVAVGTPVTIVGSLSGEGTFSEVARRLER